jgi:hypothetical protein
MPNPFVGNDEAVAFINRMTSRRAIEAHATELHDKGIVRHREALKSIENEMYPEQPRKFITKKESDALAKEMIDDFLARKAADTHKIEREMFQDAPFTPVTSMSDKVTKPVPLTAFEEMQKKAMHSRARKEKKREEYVSQFGPTRRLSSPCMDPTHVQRERKFRPAVRVDPTKTDGRAYLVSDRVEEYSASRERERHEYKGDALKEYYARLAKPNPHQTHTKYRPTEVFNPPFVTNLKYGKAGRH